MCYNNVLSSFYLVESDTFYKNLFKTCWLGEAWRTPHMEYRHRKVYKPYKASITAPANLVGFLELQYSPKSYLPGFKGGDNVSYFITY